MNPDAAGAVELQNLVQRVIGLIVELGFIAMLVFLFWGGIKFLTSGGEAKATQEAGSIITWALLGILFYIIAFLILRIISAFTGVDVLHFCLGFPGGPNHCS